MGALNRSVVAPLSSAIITVMVAGLVVAGVDSVDRNKVREGTARLDPSGLVEVSIGGAPFIRASHGRTLGAGDHVRVIDGRAVLELPHSSKVELRAGSAVTVNGATQPAIGLDEGDLLVETGQGDTVTIDGGTSQIAVAGSGKLRRGVSLAAGVYEGTARLQRNEQALTVPQYRQAAVVGTGILPQAPDPLGLSPADEWDRRMLGSVMALDEQLTLIARSFEAEVPPSPGPDLFKSLTPQVAALPITPELLGGRAAGENLVGFTLVALDKGDFLDRFQRIFGFRGQGASWGLVAADRAINPNPVLSDLEQALAKFHPGDLPGDQALPPLGSGFLGGRVNTGGGSSTGGTGGTGIGPATPGGSGGSGGGTGGSGGSGGGTGGSGGSGGGGGGSGGGGTTPGKLIDVPPTGTFLDPLLGPVVGPVEDLLSGLLGGLLGQGTPTTGSGSSTSLSPVTKPAATLPASSPTSGTTGSVSAGSGSTGTVTSSGGSTPTTTGTTAPASTTTTTSGGLLGGIVGGLTKPVGGLLR
jgi:hypothetical protein